jgi:hypothetical protein
MKIVMTGMAEPNDLQRLTVVVVVGMYFACCAAFGAWTFDQFSISQRIAYYGAGLTFIRMFLPVPAMILGMVVEMRSGFDDCPMLWRSATLTIVFHTMRSLSLSC